MSPGPGGVLALLIALAASLSLRPDRVRVVAAGALAWAVALMGSTHALALGIGAASQVEGVAREAVVQGLPAAVVHPIAMALWATAWLTFDGGRRAERGRAEPWQGVAVAVAVAAVGCAAVGLGVAIVDVGLSARGVLARDHGTGVAALAMGLTLVACLAAAVGALAVWVRPGRGDGPPPGV